MHSNPFRRSIHERRSFERAGAGPTPTVDRIRTPARTARALGRLLLLGLATLVLLSNRAVAQQVLVTNTNDSGPGSLRDAITLANATPGTTISVVATGNIQLTDPLPPITASMSIQGPGASNLTIDGGGANRVFMVLSGNVTVSDLSVNNGLAQGGAGNAGSWGNAGGGGGGLGAGGALFVNSGASVTLQNVPMTNNAAVGGAGGALGDPEYGSGGGGGGGLGGNGGAGGGNPFTATGGGGGGGIYNSSTDNGAGGTGGVNADGTNGTPTAGGGGGGGTDGQGGTGAPGAGNGAAGGTLSSGGGGGGGIGGGNASVLNGGAGGFGGGGGGGGLDTGTFQSSTGGNGGYGGGGGGGGGVAYIGAPGNGGNGGFGGGGGAGNTTLGATPGTGGQYGGNGGASGGGGGAALGGAVFVAQGGTLVVDGTTLQNSSVTSGTGGGDGQNGQALGSALFLEGVNLTFQGNHDAIVNDSIGGTGSVTQNGPGSTTLNGASTYTGATAINGGRLIVNGSIASQTTVNAGASLGGSGTINQNVINDGTIAPGNSIGTLHVGGNYTHSANAGLDVEINDQGQGDRVAVQGKATLQGGVVNVRSQPGNYLAGSRYTFLTAQSISGQFDSINDDLPFLTATLGYSAQSVYFTLFNSDANYVDVAQTHNEFAFSSYLDQAALTANGDFALALGQLDTLTADEARSAYSQLDGDFHGSLSQVGAQNTTLILYQLNNRLASGLFPGDGGSADPTIGYDGASAPVVFVRCDNSPGGIQLVERTGPRTAWNAWSMGYGLGGNVQSNGNVSGINYGMGGMLAGLGLYLNESTLFGFYGGYVGTGVSARDLNQSGSVNGGQFGSYLRGSDRLGYYTLIGGLEFDGYRTRRSIAFGNIDTAATANYSGWQGYAYGERGLTFGGPRVTLQPYGALQYVYVRQNSFSEQGAGALNLEGRGTDANSLRTFVGGRATFRPYSRLSPQLRAAWVHELLSTSSVVNAHFGAVGGGAFAVQGLSLGRDWALVGGSLNWQISGGWSLWGSYDAMVNSRQVFHVGSGGVQFVW